MGWATDDSPKVEAAKLAIVNARASIYLLRQVIATIGHTEKRSAMSAELDTAVAGIEGVERHLNR